VNDAFGIPATVTAEDSRFIVGGYPAITTSETSPRHVEFNTDGTKMFIVGGTLDFVYEWTLTTGFDISTATYDGGAEAFDLHKNNNAAKGDGQPRGIHFSPDGKKMFVVGNAADEINQYTLSTGFDVSTTSTANPVRKDITATVGGSPQGLEFNTDGTKMFVIHRSGNNSLHEFTLTTGFDLSTMVNDGSHVKSTVIDDLNGAFGIAFSSDGTKMFVVENSNASDGTDQTVNEYTLSTGFDITTASFTYSFDYSDEAVDIHGVEFSDDGKKMFLMDTKLNSRNGTGYLYEYILSCPWQLTGDCNAKNKCYDCEAPRLVQVQVGITSNKNASDDSMTHVMKEEYVWNFPINDPLSMRYDNITPITANPGDEIEITLDVIDDKSVHLLPTSGIYTNFMERPNDMNLFFVSNFDENHNTSTSFYEWNRNHDDVAYDYADTVTWRNPDISYTQFPVTTQTPFELLNDELVIEHFIISFKMKFDDPMRPSQVWVSAADYYGQTFKVPLPLTLEILGDEPIDFTLNLNQEVLGYFNEPVLLSMLYQWSETSNEMSELSSILGVNGELPSWTANLATWTVEEKITPAEMIIAIEHVINNS
jgi:hypothetical protein